MSHTLGGRLQTWRALGRVGVHREDEEVVGGRSGEFALQELVAQQLDHQGAQIFAGRRVWCPRRKRRREIDLMVFTPHKILLFEVKNWSGELFERGGAWIQRRRNGEEIRHGNLAADQQDRCDVLLDYLHREGINCDEDLTRRISPRVIFMNPNLVLDAAIARHPDVLTRDQLAQALPENATQAPLHRWLMALAEFCLGQNSGNGGKAMSPQRFQALCSVVAKLPTWDSLRLFGGKVVTGDLHEFRIGGVSHRRERFPTGSWPLSWTRNRSWGLFKALTGMGTLGRLRTPEGTLSLTTGDTVTFQPAGTPNPITVSLLEVEAVSVG